MENLEKVSVKQEVKEDRNLLRKSFLKIAKKGYNTKKGEYLRREICHSCDQQEEARSITSVALKDLLVSKVRARKKALLTLSPRVRVARRGCEVALFVGRSR